MADELVETTTEIEPVWIPDSLVLEWPFGASDARPITYLRETPKREVADELYDSLSGLADAVASTAVEGDWPVLDQALDRAIGILYGLADRDKGDDPHQEAYDEFNATALADGDKE